MFTKGAYRRIRASPLESLGVLEMAELPMCNITLNIQREQNNFRTIFKRVEYQTKINTADYFSYTIPPYQFS